MIEKHLILEDIDPIVFYGVNNGHLQMLKSLFPKLRIVARDNVMRVIGDEEEIAKIEEDVEKLRLHVLKYNSLNDEDILDIVKGKKTKAESAKGVLAYSISGRPIKSRSENQQKLIDSFEKNRQGLFEYCTCCKSLKGEGSQKDHSFPASSRSRRKAWLSSGRHER